MDIFLGLLVLSGLFALFQLLLPGRSGRGIGIAQWLSWIALATALVAFLGSGRAGETIDRLTGNFVDRPSPRPTLSPTISPIPIGSSPTPPNPSLSPPPLTPSPDSLTSNIAIEGWNQATDIAEDFLSQLSPSPVPSPTPSPAPNPFPSPTPIPSPSPSPNPIPPPIPSPSPNPVPPPIPPSPTPQPPINGLW